MFSARTLRSRGLVAIFGAGLATLALSIVPQAAFAGPADRLAATDPCTRVLTGPQVGVQAVAVGEFLCLRGANLEGAINVAAGGALRIVKDSTVVGAITSTGATSITICDSKIIGAITATGGVGLPNGLGGVSIGDNAACLSNLIEGAVTLNGNTGSLRLSGNTVGGAVTVNGNATGTKWGVRISNNEIADALSCAGNTPAPINLNLPNHVTGARSGQCLAGNF